MYCRVDRIVCRVEGRCSPLPGTPDPYRNQWAYLVALGRMSPGEAHRAAEDQARRAGLGSPTAGRGGAQGKPLGGCVGHPRPAGAAAGAF
jgi:hypothetical protein